MAIQKINLGTEPHGIGGDSYRTANDKINKNFEEVSTKITSVDEKYSNTEVKITEEIARAKQVEDELKVNLEKEASRAVSAEANILGVVEAESRARTAENIQINEAQTQLKGFVDSEVEKLKLEDTSIKTSLDKTHRYAVMSQTLGLGSKFYDKDGQPLSGGKVYTYEAGTSTPLDTYKDVDFKISNTNPIILDETGSADVFLKDTYRFRIFDKDDIFIEEQELVKQPVSLQQLKENALVVDSVTDLSTIKNPKDGLRVHVKSYHAGLRRGGGYFIYDSSKASINDHGNVINGWVRDLIPNYLDLFNFGAVGDGVEKVYDHLAFEYISEYIKNTDYENYTINIPTPQKHYLVGLQEINDDGTLDNHSILSINGDSRTLNIQIVSNNAKIRFNDGLYFGTFTREGLQAYEHEMPFYGSRPAYKEVADEITLGQAGTMFSISSCERLVIEGGLELDGNRAGHILGGQWGDTGWQIASTGIRAMYNKACFMSNIDAHDFGLDGIYTSTTCTLESDYVGTAEEMSEYRNIRSYRNSRQGFSITGGANINMENCIMSMNGHSSLSHTSAPRSNMDIEAERAPIRNLNVTNCVSYLGRVIADSGNSKGLTFNNCKFISSEVGSQSLWVDKLRAKFFNCYFNGEIRKTPEHNVKEGEQALFDNCVIEMNSRTHPSDVIAHTENNFIFEGSGHFVVKNSVINIERSGLTYGRGSASTIEGIRGSELHNVIINVYDQPRFLIMPDFMRNVEIRDLREDVTKELRLYMDNANIDNVTVTGSKEGHNIRPLSNRGFVAPEYGSNVLVKFANTSNLLPEVTQEDFKLNTSSSSILTKSNLVRMAYNTALSIKTNTKYREGDRIYCTDPTKNIDYWVCVKGGIHTEESPTEWKGVQSVDVVESIITVGTTNQRPSSAPKGHQYFDTTLNKPIYYTGTSWVDSTGTAV